MKHLQALWLPVAAFVFLTSTTVVFAAQEKDGDLSCALFLEDEDEEMAPMYFRTCSGMGSWNEVTEHKVIGDGNVEIVRKIPGRLRYDDIVLERGIASNMDLWDWRQEVVDGNVDDARRNGFLVIYDEKSTEVARWSFVDAWPSKVTSPSLKADSDDIGLEELTIVHEGIYRMN